MGGLGTGWDCEDIQPSKQPYISISVTVPVDVDRLALAAFHRSFQSLFTPDPLVSAKRTLTPREWLHQRLVWKGVLLWNPVALLNQGSVRSDKGVQVSFDDNLSARSTGLPA